MTLFQVVGERCILTPSSKTELMIGSLFLELAPHPCRLRARMVGMSVGSCPPPPPPS